MVFTRDDCNPSCGLEEGKMFHLISSQLLATRILSRGGWETCYRNSFEGGRRETGGVQLVALPCTSMYQQTLSQVNKIQALSGTLALFKVLHL